MYGPSLPAAAERAAEAHEPAGWRDIVTLVPQGPKATAARCWPLQLASWRYRLTFTPIAPSTWKIIISARPTTT